MSSLKPNMIPEVRKNSRAMKSKMIFLFEIMIILSNDKYVDVLLARFHLELTADFTTNWTLRRQSLLLILLNCFIILDGKIIS